MKNARRRLLADFFDSRALVKRYVSERGSDLVRATLAEPGNPGFVAAVAELAPSGEARSPLEGLAARKKGGERTVGERTEPAGSLVP